MQTKQTNALNSATNLSVLMAKYIAFMNSVQAYLADYNQSTWDAVWSQLPTAEVNADGTLGTADGTPNNARPITVPAGAPLLMSRNDLIGAKALLDVLNTLYTQAGGTVSVPAQAPAKTAALLAPNTTGQA